MSDTDTVKARLQARAEAAIKEFGLTEHEAMILDGLVIATVACAIAEKTGEDVMRRNAMLEAAWLQVAAAGTNKIGRALNRAFVGFIADILRGVVVRG